MRLEEGKGGVPARKCLKEMKKRAEKEEKLGLRKGEKGSFEKRRMLEREDSMKKRKRNAGF